MPILKCVSYTGDEDHVERTNSYISDGHGDAIELARTNRYITGAHGRGNVPVGINCPSTPELATAYMASLAAQYQKSIGQRRTRGAMDAPQGVIHYQLILSWYTLECIPASERIQIVKELIQRTKLKDHAILIQAHDNTDEPHVHLSTSAYSLDGVHKLCMNKALLNDLRRELDYISVEHGYSIVYAPELFNGHPEYRAWYEAVKASGKITIHPGRSQKNTPGAQEQPKVSLDQIGYSLPQVFDPQNPEQMLRIRACNDQGERYSPLVLDLFMLNIWTRRFREQLEEMPDFSGREVQIQRLKGLERDTYTLGREMEKLDIGTRRELHWRTSTVGKEIQACKQEISYQQKVIASAQSETNAEKEFLAQQRLDKTEALLKARSQEYRKLKHITALLKMLDTNPHLSLARTKLETKHTGSRGQNVQDIYTEVGKLFRIPQENIVNLIQKALHEEAPEAFWAESRKVVSATLEKKQSGLSVLYQCIREDYVDRRKLRTDWYDFQREFPVIGIVTLILYLALVVPMAIVQVGNEQVLDWHIAQARRLCEEIHWHNRNCDRQLQTAKTILALKLIQGESQAADMAWKEFETTCQIIMDRTNSLKQQEQCLTAGRAGYSSVHSVEQKIQKIMAVRHPPLVEQIAQADGKRTRQS